MVLPDTFADTFAWSPPSSPTPFPIPAPSSSSVDTVVTGDSTTSLAAASASTDTNTSFPSATTQPTVLQTQEHALLTTSAYASTSSSTTSTTAGDGARVTPLATVHHHGVILGDVTTTTTTTTTSAQMAPVQGLAESSPAVTSTTRSSRLVVSLPVLPLRKLSCKFSVVNFKLNQKPWSGLFILKVASSLLFSKLLSQPL